MTRTLCCPACLEPWEVSSLLILPSSHLISHTAGHSAWLQGLKSPLIKDEDDSGSKELKLRFDVSEYAPEEIMVKTVDNKLLVNFILDNFLCHLRSEMRSDIRMSLE